MKVKLKITCKNSKHKKTNIGSIIHCFKIYSFNCTEIKLKQTGNASTKIKKSDNEFFMMKIKDLPKRI